MAGEMFGAVLKYSGATPKLAARQRNQVQKESFTYALEYWHANYRDKHFTHEGAREYGYAPRSGDRGSGRRFKGSYTARKLKKFGHTRPLEWSGRSRSMATRKNIKATSKGGRARIHAPALNFRRRPTSFVGSAVRRGGAPREPINMRDEMTRVSDRERGKLAHEFQEYMTGRFNRLTETATTNI